MTVDATSIYFDSKNSVFMLTDNASTSRDISPYITNADFTNQFKVVDVTTYGKIGTVPFLTLDDSKFTLDLVWNQVTTTGVQATVESLFTSKTARPFIYYPAGATSGNLKISGNAVVSVYPFSGKVGDAVRVKAEFLVNNGVTFGTAT